MSGAEPFGEGLRGVVGFLGVHATGGRGQDRTEHRGRQQRGHQRSEHIRAWSMISYFGGAPVVVLRIGRRRLYGEGRPCCDSVLCDGVERRHRPFPGQLLGDLRVDDHT